MSTAAEDIVENRLTRDAWGCRLGLVCFIGVAIYVLSFGPAINLTMTIKGAGYDRAARFPSLANTVNVLYSPLFGVLVGKAGSNPRHALNWYVHCWTYSPAPWELETKEFQADLNRTLERLREKMKERR